MELPISQIERWFIGVMRKGGVYLRKNDEQFNESLQQMPETSRRQADLFKTYLPESTVLRDDQATV